VTTVDSPHRLDGLLTVNTGSSSVKLALYGNDPVLPRHLQVSVERIGLARTELMLNSSSSGSTRESIEAHDHASALVAALENAQKSIAFTPCAVGHRIVHGGADHAQPTRVTPALQAELHRLESIDPTHMPQALAAVDTIARQYPNVPQYACFDTAFHSSMPAPAQRYPLPKWAADAGVRRYGFHGLSCEFIVSELERIDRDAADGRLLIAHLGNGASITAVHRGFSLDTTMGFSPSGGLMMGTRCGDLDPTVLTYLARTRHSSVEDLQHLVNDESGLLGVSGISGDVRDLLEEGASSQAAEAIELFCYTARKHVGALAAVLDGIDTFVFTGGIGEHAAVVREKICSGLGHLGVQLHLAHNAANHDVISDPHSRVVVRVMQTDEDLVIARHVRDLLD